MYEKVKECLENLKEAHKKQGEQITTLTNILSSFTGVGGGPDGDPDDEMDDGPET